MSSAILSTATDAASTSIIYRACGGVAGLREVSDEAANLSVVAFPIEQLDQVAATRSLAVPACYMLTNGSTTYVGETGNVGVRLAQHLADQTKNFATEVFVIGSASERCLDKTAAIVLQHHFTNAVELASLVNLKKGRNPQTIELPMWRRASLERLVQTARRLLFDAGCRTLDSNNPRVLLSALPNVSIVPPSTPDDSDENGLLTIGVPIAPDGCEEYELLYANLWARGYAYDEDFVVCVGSEIRVGINQSANPILWTRRRELAEAGALQMIRGVEDRQRLTIAVAFPSAAIAAKVVTGAHVNANSWQKLRQTQAMIVAK
jgi:hypothetical protein